MTVKTSGDLGLENDIVGEFGGTAPHAITEYYRGGGLVDDNSTNAAAGVPTSGEISLGDFYGSGNVTILNLAITSNTNNYDLYTQVSSNPAYAAGASIVNLTVNPGVTVGSTSTGTYALSIPSAFSPTDQINVTNQGTIVGRAGNGGGGGNHPLGNGVAGQAGGHALYINRPVNITNNGTIAGAGGGGGGSGTSMLTIAEGQKGQTFATYGGSGGGGGAGVQAGSGGAAGTGAAPEYNGNAGSSGNDTQGGAGGATKYNSYIPRRGWTGAGGTGGARGANGVAGVPPGANSPSYVQNPRPPGAGGATGRYITGQSFATWQTTGTQLGGSS